MSRKTPAIGDTSVLLTFASIDRLDLLEAVFARIDVPPAVQREVYAKDMEPNRLLFGAFERGTTFLRADLSAAVETTVAAYAITVGRGEAETIALGRFLHRLVLLDDLAARKLAAREGVAVMGSLGVLSECKSAGIVPEVRPLAEAMHEAGRFFSSALLRDFFHRMEEL